MPTGYTAAIKRGISFEQFIWSCARNFGALIMMRDMPSDAPIPERFEPSEWHVKELAKVSEELEMLKGIDTEQLEATYQAARNMTVFDNEKAIRDAGEMREKYTAMLSLVRAWQPPSKDHEGLKKFMEQQIEESIKFDCSVDYHIEIIKKFPKSSEEWQAGKIGKLLWSLDYHTKENQEEIARTEGRNRWLRQLRESVKAKP